MLISQSMLMPMRTRLATGLVGPTTSIRSTMERVIGSSRTGPLTRMVATTSTLLCMMRTIISRMNSGFTTYT